MTDTTMRAFTGTHVSGALARRSDGSACPEAARGAVRAVAIDNSKGVSARRYRHT